MTTLILGGTSEATALAKVMDHEAVLSLAGVTATRPKTPHRIGGFGGTSGLTHYIYTHKISAVIDATHPFAAQMSHHAANATTASGVPLLRVVRPEWPVEPEWWLVPSLKRAAEIIPPNARVFLTVGSRSLSAFLPRDDLWCLSRSIEPPMAWPKGELRLQRPPFVQNEECALMKANRISHLVCKNAGGTTTRAKLEAAKALGVQVIMIQRPVLPAAPEVDTVEQALKWWSHTEGKQ